MIEEGTKKEELEEPKEEAPTEEVKVIGEEIKPEEKLIVRTYPKITVFAYIIAVITILFGVAEALTPAALYDTVAKALGLTFVLAFFFLLLISAFEFSEVKFFLTIALVVIIVLVFVYLSSVGIISLGILKTAYELYTPVINTHAYLGIGVGSLFVLFLIWAKSRFDYWVIEPNQVLHKTGIFGAMDRFPTRTMRFRVEVKDVLEYILFFRSGSLILDFPAEKKSFVLSLVPHVKKVEQRIQDILAAVEVE